MAMKLPTNNELLECVTRHAAQYLCENLGPLIAKYACASFEIITQEGTVYFDDEKRTWMCIPFNQKPQTNKLAKLNDKIYAVGGFYSNDNLCVTYYDATHHWTRVASMHILRYHHRVAVLNGKLYAVGGHDTSKAFSSVECYDDIKDQWTTVASMNTRRFGHGVGVLKGMQSSPPEVSTLRAPLGGMQSSPPKVGKLYAVGGHDGSKVLSSVECYDDTNNQWTTVASMNTTRYAHDVGVLNGKLYAVGGSDGRAALNSVEYYDDVSNQWTTVASMNTKRYFHRIQVFNGKLYAVGGHDGNNDLSSVECYDDGSNTWTVVPEMTIDEKYRGLHQ